MKRLICPDCGKSFSSLVYARIRHDTCPRCTFWKLYDRSGGPDACWPWLSQRNKQGYGIVWPSLAAALVPTGGKKRSMLAHRLSFRLHRRVNPGLLCVAHDCDNPACGNPTHLSLCTQAENLAGGVARGRPIAAAPGELNRHAKLSPDLVHMIRTSAVRSGDLALRLGVHRGTIAAIRRKATWRHILDQQE
jgi:hypothetical protein